MAGLILLALLLFLGWEKFRPEWDRGNRFAPRREAFLLLWLPNGSTNAPLAEPTKRLEGVFGDRLKLYREAQATLTKNMLFQAVFVIMSIIAIKRFDLQEFEIAPFGKKLSRSAALFILPIGLVYFWGQFGFVLSEAIDLRMSLWRIAQALQASPEDFRNHANGDLKFLFASDPSLTNAVSWTNAAYTYGYARVLHDGSFLDGWFEAFLDTQTLVGKSSGLAVLHVWLWAIFLGVQHAAILAALISRRMIGGRSRFSRFCHDLGLGAVLLYLAFTHVGFMVGGGHHNWMQPATLAGAVFALPILACSEIWPPLRAWFDSQFQSRGRT